MRHHTAAQKGDGGWHYVSMSRDGGHPLGYCAEHEPHATEAEARECYAQYRRDNVTLDGKCGWTRCTYLPAGADRYSCDNPANQFASIKGDGYAMAPLCEEHLTIDHAIDALHLIGAAGDAWQS